MKANLTIPDRVIRLIIAGILAVLAISNVLTGTWAGVAVAVAVIFTITALINFCPLYRILGIRRWEKKEMI